MKQITLLSLVLGVAMAAGVIGACKRQEDPRLGLVLSKLDAIDQRLGNLEKRPAGGPAVQPATRPRPDANTVYYLPVDAGDGVLGAAHGKVTIVEAFEFACPHCMTTSALIEQILAKYPDVQVVQKQYIIHPQVATLPALAACAATKQGKYAAFEKELWKRAWPTDGGNPHLDQSRLSADALAAQAKDLGLDVARFTSDMNGEACRAELGQKMASLSAVGVNGTPALFINGKPWQGARSIEAIGPAIEAELARADQALAGGTRLEDYYASLIKTGKKTL